MHGQRTRSGSWGGAGSAAAISRVRERESRPIALAGRTRSAEVDIYAAKNPSNGHEIPGIRRLGAGEGGAVCVVFTYALITDAETQP